MLLVPTSILLRGNIWFIANCVIKLHQHERRLRLQCNQGELMKDIIFVGNKQRALMEDNLFSWKIDQLHQSTQPWGATMSIDRSLWWCIIHLASSLGEEPMKFILIVVCFFSLIKLEEGRTTWQRTVRRNNNGHPILCSSTKIEEDMPGYGDTHRCFQKYKKG